MPMIIPGVLNLDIDLVRTLIGGWRDRFAETGQIVAHDGGTALLASMYGQLTSVLAARPQVTVLASSEGAITEDYQALTAILRTT